MTVELANKVRNVVSVAIGSLPDKPSSRLREDLSADSLDLVELHMLLEGEFEVEISDDEFDKCLTVADVYELVNRKVAH